MREMGTTRAPSDWQPPARRRWSEDDGRAMAQAYAASGLSGAAFAQRHGLQVARVLRWLARLDASMPVRADVAFAPVRLIERAPEHRGGVEIVVGEHRVRVTAGFCSETLRQVLAALTEGAC